MCYIQKSGNWQEQSLEVLHTQTYVTDPKHKFITKKHENRGKIQIGSSPDCILRKQQTDHLDLVTNSLFYMLCFHPCQNKRKTINSS